jgi:hypothetical protein
MFDGNGPTCSYWVLLVSTGLLHSVARNIYSYLKNGRAFSDFRLRPCLLQTTVFGEARESIGMFKAGLAARFAMRVYNMI